jgi:ribosomal protein S6
MENTKKYSALFIIIPEKLDVFDEFKGGITSVIGEYSGNVLGETVMGKRTLAYPIKKRKEAVYYEVVFAADPETVPKMMRQFRINTDILRTLIDKNE